MAVEPGVKSSEWKGLILALLIQVGMGAGVMTEDEAAKIRAYEVGAIITGIATVTYAGLRTFIKAKAMNEGESPEDALAEVEQIRAQAKAKAKRFRAIADEIDEKLNAIENKDRKPEVPSNA